MNRDYVSARTKPPALCNYCRGFLDTLQENGPGLAFGSSGRYSEQQPPIQHYNKYQDLFHSAKKGCHLCEHLCRKPGDCSKTHPNSEGEAHLVMDKNRLWRLELKFLDGNGHSSQCCYHSVYFYPISRSNPTLNSSAFDTSKTTKDALPLTKTWFSKCRREHSSCRSTPSLQSKQLPTRLLDLKSTNLRLVSGNSLDKSTEYVTLSHCWGNKSFITLKTDSTTQCFTKIVYEDLPQTFKDAIFTARYLGLNYLWIDSLCIVQDDKDDWKKESALMASVYGNSALTIAASGASNANVGCFFEQKPSFRLRVKLEIKGIVNFYECIPNDFKIADVFQEQPLLTRGWVVQERILSRRTLQCTTEELFWECAEMHASEKFPETTLERIPYFDHKLLPKPPFDLVKWKSVVQIYSGCRLTDGDDKLVALSGLAQASQLGVWQQYFAGLWEENIEQQLCWYVNNSEGSRHSSYRAPSWSWASVDGFTVFEPKQWYSSLLVKAQKVSVQLAREEEPYGQVQGGSIRLLCTYLLHSQPCSFPFQFDDTRDRDYSMNNYLLPIQCQLGQSGWKPAFLLLLRPTGKRNGQYYRVGSVRVYDLELIIKRDSKSSTTPEDYLEMFVNRKNMNGRQFVGAIELV